MSEYLTIEEIIRQYKKATPRMVRRWIRRGYLPRTSTNYLRSDVESLLSREPLLIKSILR